MKRIAKVIYALLSLIFMLILTGIALILTPVRIAWELSDDFSDKYYQHIDKVLDTKKGEKAPKEEEK